MNKLIWTHAICTACWIVRSPNRIPHRLVHAEAQDCCFCGQLTTTGIFVREDPKSPHLKHCKGEHDEDES